MKTFKQFLEGYRRMPSIDKERYPERPGLEGPFGTMSGKVLYYDPKEGKYYDSDSDMYVSYDDYEAYNKSDQPFHDSPLTDPTTKDYKHFARKNEAFYRHPNPDKGGHVNFHVEEIGYRPDRPPIPGLPHGDEDNEIYEVVYGIDYDVVDGMKGQYGGAADFYQQMTPDDPDEYKVNRIEVLSVNGQKFDANHPILAKFGLSQKALYMILMKYFEDNYSEEAHDYIIDRDMG